MRDKMSTFVRDRRSHLAFGSQQIGDAGAVQQQVLQRDRADGNLDIGKRPAGAAQHLPVGEFRQISVDRLTQPQPALFDQHQRGNARSRPQALRRTPAGVTGTEGDGDRYRAL